MANNIDGQEFIDRLELLIDALYLELEPLTFRIHKPLIDLIKNKAISILDRFWRQGYLKGWKPCEAYYINDSNQDELDIHKMKIGLALSKPNEFFKINLNVNRRYGYLQLGAVMDTDIGHYPKIVLKK